MKQPNGEGVGGGGVHPGFETQVRRHQESETGSTSGPTKRTDVLQTFYKKKEKKRKK